MTLESRAILRDLVSFQHRRCAYCGRHMGKVEARGPREQAKMTATVDHMEPVWAGGADDSANRVAACFDCNQQKGPLDAATFLRVRHNPEALRIARRLAESRATSVAREDGRRLGDPPSLPRGSRLACAPAQRGGAAEGRNDD